jgi:hypothetical protein
MHVAGDLAPAVAITHQLQGAQHGAGVIPVAMAQHHGLDRAEIDAEPRDILFERAIFRAGIEEHGVHAVAPTQGEQAGQAVRGATQAGTSQHPGRATPSCEASQLGLDERGHGGERIGDIVDEDLDVDGVDGDKAGHALSLVPDSRW